jgi:hypothetical protein
VIKGANKLKQAPPILKSNFKRYFKYIIGIPERKEGEKSKEKLSKVLIVKN